MSGNSNSGIHLPTVFVAAGVSAVVSALIATVGVVGVMFASDDDNSAAASVQPTVVNLGAAATPQQPAAAPAAPAPLAPPPAAPAAPAAPLAAPPPPVVSGGGTSGGGAVAAPAPAVAEMPSETAAPAVPAALSPEELTGKLSALLNGSNEQKAAELEAGGRGVPVGEGIGRTLRMFEPVGLKWGVSGPVVVNGNTLTANLVLRSPGFNDAMMGLTWVWVDGSWKLSNTSACEIAGYAQVPCSL